MGEVRGRFRIITIWMRKQEKRNRKKIEYELREMFKDYDMYDEAEEKGNRKKKTN